MKLFEPNMGALQVARDVLIKYVDSDAFGTKTFDNFLEKELADEGVLNLFKLRGKL